MTQNKRKVFYISGFDPRGAKHYHSLYKQEVEKECAITGEKITVFERKKTSEVTHQWLIENGKTQTDYTYLVWDDIIKNSWVRNPIQIFAKGMACYWHYVTSGFLYRTKKVSNVAFMAGFMPLLYLLLAPIISFFVALGLYNLSEKITFLPHFASASIAAIFFLAFLYWIIKMGDKIKVYWLLRIYIFFWKHIKNTNQEYLNRVEQFSQIIEQAIKSKEYDEVLIAAHSVGGIPMILALAKIAERNSKNTLDNLKVVTMGHAIALGSFHPTSEDFRHAIKILSECKIDWLNVSSPADGACYVMVSPFNSVIPLEKDYIKTISPKFHKMFTEKKYKKLRRDKFRMHFQYLMASDILNEYSYFKITCGEINPSAVDINH